MIIIIVGVAGSGKTTIGSLLARRLGWSFSDADEFHSVANKQKMSTGIPLTDEDRAPWLEAMRSAIERWLRNGDNHILACSALKKSYRDFLRQDDSSVKLVYLRCSKKIVTKRLGQRQEHFMKVNMVDSQFQALEEPTPDEALTIDGDQALNAVVEAILVSLKRGLPD